MNRSAILLETALFAVSALFSCGKTEPQTSVSAEETTDAVTESETFTDSTADSNKANENGKKKSHGFGMMGYVNKSRLVTACSSAKLILSGLKSYLIDYEITSDIKIAYSNTGNGDFGKYLKNDYSSQEEDFDYIVIFNKDQEPDLVLAQYHGVDSYTGVFGGSIRLETEYTDVDWTEMKWSETLEKLGLTAGNYTDMEFKAKETEDINNNDQ